MLFLKSILGDFKTEDNTKPDDLRNVAHLKRAT